jgi:hypothetical protein
LLVGLVEGELPGGIGGEAETGGAVAGRATAPVLGLAAAVLALAATTAIESAATSGGPDAVIAAAV